MDRSPVYLWTGLGWGKTTSALGVCLRQAGHNQKAVVIQFMKGWGDKLGEVKVMDKLKPYYKIYQFGKKDWVDLKNPSEEDKNRAKKALEFAKEILERDKPNLLVLDEVNLACHIGLLKAQDVINFCDQSTPPTFIYLTGRYAPKELVKRADFATEISIIKKSTSIVGGKGIDY